MFLIFLQVWKGDDPLSDSLDIDFIDYFIKEFVDKMVSSMDVHVLIALLKIDDKAIYAVQHKFVDVECRLNFSYLCRHYTQNIPEYSPY